MTTAADGGPFFDKARVLQTIEAISRRIFENKDYLTDLDAKIGDADHGLNLARGFAAVTAKLPEVEGQCIGTILKTVGMTLVSTVGGASGPLYGTAFMHAGAQVVGKQVLERADVVKMAQAALDGIMKRGNARPGDKTMVDTIAPVVEYLASAEALEASDQEVARRAVAIARDGMERTRDMVALKGRASFLKERSAGHLDPGAVSSFLMIEVIAEQVLNEV